MTGTSRPMVAASHETHERLVEEQAALRRVATLVARGARPEEIFAAVSNEVGRLVGTDSATVIRYDDDGQGISYVGSASKVRGAFPMGVHWRFQEGMASYDVYRTGRSARSGAHLITVDGPIGDVHREMGIVSAVASPIVVDGHLWGAMAVHSQEPLPPETEERVEKFTELVATAIANAESRSGLTRLAEEQAALRRVATLVARGTQPQEVFAAVANEVRRLVGSESATVMKFVDDDGPGIVFVGVASKMSSAFPLGAHWKFKDGMASAEVFRTGRSARSDSQDWSEVEGPVGETHHRLGIMSAVASPIVVDGSLWGAMAVQSQEDLPIDTDVRLEKFTALVATAIANAESRATLTRLADEQAALRRVATLVARGVRADELFAAVSNELGRLFGTDSATVVKYDDEGAGIIFVGVASRVSAAFPLGAHWLFREGMASAEVYRTGRSARTGTHLLTVDGPIGDVQRGLGITSSVASPIVVEGRLWGAMSVQSQTPLPPDTDERVEKFTELLATAIADAESREALGRLAEELAASRARIVAAADEERRRVVRDLHDGAQQRLVHTIITLKLAGRALQNEEEDLPALLSEALDHAEQANHELRELAHGILPSVLTQGGLRAGVEALATRIPVPVENDVTVGRLPAAVEATAYFVVAEAFTNVAKHAQARHAHVTARIENGTVQVEIRDDGVGGAGRGGGSGLTGLADRLAVLDGELRVDSPADGGTLVSVVIPLPG